MAEKIYIKPVGTGTWQEATTYLMGFKFHDKGKAALNKLDVVFRNDIKQTAINPTYQSDIKWESGSFPVFAGRIEKPVSEFPQTKIMAYSYGAELLDQLINEVYENLSPEAIAQSIIESGGDLVYSSTATSGIVIDKIVFRDKKKSEALGILADLLGWSFRTEYDKTAYFEPPGETDSGLVLTIGDNVLGKPKWDYNPEWVVNKVIVEGGLQDFATTETFAGPSNTFSMTYEPSGSVKVLEGAVELIPTVEGSTETQDYTVDAENKNILTGSSRSNVSVNYSYKIPIRIEQITTTDYPNKDLKVKNKSIKSYAEARKTGREILTIRQNPLKNASLPIYGYDSSVKSGYLTRVVDADEKDADGNGLDESMVIVSLVYTYPQNVFEIKVGTDEYILYNLLSDIDERIRELQQSDTNSDIIQGYRLFKEGLTIDLKHTVTHYTRDVNDSFIWGSGTWGSGTWGDRCDGDNFTSYASGNYTLGDYWSGTGSYSVSDSKLVMDSAAKVTYIGRDSTNSFQLEKGKIKLYYDKNTSTDLNVYLIERDSDNYLIINLDHTSNTINLKKRESGIDSTFESSSFVFPNSNTFFMNFSSNTFRIISGTTDIIGTNTFNFTTGSFSIESVGGNSRLDKVEIYTGV
jgi:hypothetical protein